MAKAVPQDNQPDTGEEDLYFITIPLVTYREIARVAGERGMTFAQALGTAFRDFLKSADQGR